jgi:hypothetical protein
MLRDNTIPAESNVISTRNEIISNLKKINIAEESAKRFVDMVERLPGKDTLETVLKYLTHEKNPGSQREKYYQFSNYIAEFFCALSNAGFFAVGFKYGDYSVLTAGLLSALSHTIPFESLQLLDYVGILTVFAKAASEYKTLAAKPTTFAWAGGAIGVNIVDTLVARIAKKYYPEDHYLNTIVTPITHVSWHLSAAFALYELDKAVADVTNKKFDNTSAVIDIVFIGLLTCLYGIPLLYSTISSIYSGCKSRFFSTQPDNNASDLEQGKSSGCYTPFG